jgi:HK97 family phage portal protein
MEAPSAYDHLGRREPSFARDQGGPADATYWDFDSWGSPSAAGTRVSQMTAMQVTTVFACVSIVASDLAKLGLGLYRGTRKGAHQAAKNHPLYPLLYRPNAWMTGFEFVQMLQMAVMLRGNGWAVILRDGRGDPTSLVPINPDKVEMWEAPDGNLFCLVTRTGLHELAILRRLPLLIPYEDMLHLKSMTANGLMGLSAITLHREAIGLSLAQEQLASRWTANGSHMSGTLSTEQKLTKETRQALETAWQQQRAGLFNGGKAAVLEAGLQWKPLSLNLQDMEFLASRQYQVEEIARIFRVPLYMLAEAKGSTKSVGQMGQEYINYTLSTPITMWEQRLGFTFDIDPDEMFIDFDEDRLLEADISTRYAANRLALGGQPWSTVNEIRAQERKAPVEGGDELFRPVNMAPAGSDLFMANPDPDDSTVPGDTNKGDGLGSDTTGQGAEGGGRPAADGTPAQPQGVK